MKNHLGSKTTWAIALCLVTQISSASVADFAFSDSEGDAGLLMLVLDTNNQAISGSLTVTSGLDVGNYVLYGNNNPAPNLTWSTDPSQLNYKISPDGNWFYDNQIYQGANPLLDTAGLLFVGNGMEISIWNQVGPSATANPTYSFGDDGVNTLLTNDVNLYAVVPEPASVVLLTVGLFSMGATRKKAANR